MGLEASARQVIGALPGSANGLRLVCIDGFMGAGKSALAEAVVAGSTASVAVVHADQLSVPETRDWRSWTPSEGYEANFDHRRLESDVLQPLREGHAAAFQSYDWESHALDGRVSIEPKGLVVIEGVYLLRRRLRRYWDLAVFVDTPRDLRRARAYARGESDEGWLAQWMQAEDYYERVENPAAVADLVVAGF